MFQKVIYKRQYNKPTIEEIEAEIADEPIPAEVKEPAPLFGSGENNHSRSIENNHSRSIENNQFQSNKNNQSKIRKRSQPSLGM